MGPFQHPFPGEQRRSWGDPAGSLTVPGHAASPPVLPHPLEKAAALQNASPLTQSPEPAGSLGPMAPEDCWQQKQGLEEVLEGPGLLAPSPLSPACFLNSAGPGQVQTSAASCLSCLHPRPRFPLLPRVSALEWERGIEASITGLWGSLGSHKGGEWLREGSAWLRADSGHSRLSEKGA